LIFGDVRRRILAGRAEAEEEREIQEAERELVEEKLQMEEELLQDQESKDFDLQLVSAEQLAILSPVSVSVSAGAPRIVDPGTQRMSSPLEKAAEPIDLRLPDLGSPRRMQVAETVGNLKQGGNLNVAETAGDPKKGRDSVSLQDGEDAGRQSPVRSRRSTGATGEAGDDHDELYDELPARTYSPYSPGSERNVALEADPPLIGTRPLESEPSLSPTGTMSSSPESGLDSASANSNAKDSDTRKGNLLKSSKIRRVSSDHGLMINGSNGRNGSNGNADGLNGSDHGEPNDTVGRDSVVIQTPKRRRKKEVQRQAHPAVSSSHQRQPINEVPFYYMQGRNRGRLSVPVHSSPDLVAAEANAKNGKAQDAGGVNTAKADHNAMRRRDTVMGLVDLTTSGSGSGSGPSGTEKVGTTVNTTKSARAEDRLHRKKPHGASSSANSRAHSPSSGVSASQSPRSGSVSQSPRSSPQTSQSPGDALRRHSHQAVGSESQTGPSGVGGLNSNRPPKRRHSSAVLQDMTKLNETKSISPPSNLVNASSSGNLSQLGRRRARGGMGHHLHPGTAVRRGAGGYLPTSSSGDSLFQRSLTLSQRSGR